MILTSDFKPTCIPLNGTAAKSEIDRVQDMSFGDTLNRSKIEELGRTGLVDWRVFSPSISGTIRQLEHNSIEFFCQLANLPLTTTKIEFDKFSRSAMDIAGYNTNSDTGLFLSTVWYPRCRLTSFGITIGDPDALIERNFGLIGEDDITLQNNNKYLIYKTFAGTTGQNQTYTINDPNPVVDPDNSGQYMARVVRIRAGVSTELSHGLDWSFDGTNTLSINGQNYSTDTYKVWYSASSYIAGQDPFTANDTSLAGISADSADIFLVSSSRVTRLQSVGIDVSLNRQDTKEIGNKDVVQRSVRDVSTRVTLGRIIDDYSIEEVLRNVSGLSFGKIDVRKFRDEMILVVKTYTDNTKATLSTGYQFSDLAPTTKNSNFPLNDHVKNDITLEGETGFISTVNTDFAL